MKRVFTYILALLALSVACQRFDLPDNPQDNQPAELPTGAVGSKATITFSTAELLEPETRGVVDPNVEVETLHLIVFDENGMLVEVCEATELGSSDHGGHTGGKHYTVTLTVTDKPRIIHYVANCPVDQVVYGHETSIIGNMFVDRNNSKDATTQYETSYWARIEVQNILVKEKEDGTFSLADDIIDKFRHVPLLRNYAEITVTDQTDNTFYFEGFTVYNLLNRGTVAPYNSNTQQFQSFFDKDSKNYSYPDMLKEGYEGHALTSAKLITDFIRYDKDDATPGVKGKEEGDVKIYGSNEPFYVYERKVSVMTDEEEKWRESPPHIIIKGKYNNGQSITDTTGIKSYYYKMDLVYTDKTSGNEEIKYYNILRNFMYQFNLTAVHDVGYDTLEEAVAGAAGNNISGSSSTSKMTNISDSEGRLWVSYTDITLVTGDSVVFKYKYIPNYYDSTKKDTYQKVNNSKSKVNFQNIVGDVITGIKVADADITGGTWDGYREVTIYVKEPEDIIHQQILYLKTDNVNLNRQIRHTLRKKLSMEVECMPKVKGAIMEQMEVDIKLPTGMTEDMFPLMLDMETLNRTLSPDAKKNTIPVNTGPSIIESRNGELSYYYTWTIPTLDAYKALPNDGNMKVVTTHWRTNMAANASTFYVANKYFNQASDSWKNYMYEFSNATCSSSAVGVGSDVTISFNMDNDDNAYNSRLVTISLKGMTTSDGETKYSFYPKSRDVSISGFQTTTATDPVSFTLDADEYNILDPVEGTRQTYQFGGAFAATSLKAEADIEVDFTFNIPAEAFTSLKTLYPDAGDAGVPMYVILDRMHPADDQLVYSQARAEGDRYIYRIKQAGKQTIRLATTSADVGDCTVTLQADYFDTQSVTIRQKGIEFRSLTIPDKVSGGTGNAVDIKFQLAEGDSNRDVTVVLENMARNGETTLTFNTGNSNIITNNNGTYTINNVVTTGAADATLKVKISALGYEDKEVTCSDRPSLEGTISFADSSQRTSINYYNQQVWTNDGITLTNEKSSSNTNVSDRTNPVRFYNGQKLTIGAEGNIKSIKFVCNNSTYATNLKNSIGTVADATVTTSGSNVTVTFTNATATQFVINLTADVRMNSLTVAYYKQQ